MNNLLFFKSKIIGRHLFNLNFRSIIRLITYLGVIFLFLFSTYFVFSKIFEFLLKYEEIGYGLIYRIFSMMFSMFFILLVMSSIISSISTFFRTKELEFLFATPLKTSSLFFIKILENGIYASWATAIISFPLMIALGHTFNAGIMFYVFSIMDFLILIIISTSIGLIIVFLFSEYFLRHSIGGVIVILVLILASILLMMFFGKSPQLFNMPQTANLTDINNYVSSLEVEQFRFLPSGLTAQIIFNRINGIGSVNQYMIILIYILITFPLIILSMFMYRNKYLAFGKSFIKKTVKIKNKMTSNRFFKNRIIPLLIQKDIILFLRNPSQWGQSLIFLTLLAFYIFSLIRSPMYFKTPFFTYIIAFANMGFSAYISATLSVRFIFPLISLEGRSYDIIKINIGIRDFFISKLVFNFIVILLLGEMLVTGTNLFLNLDSTIILISTIVIFILSIGITIINIGIGAIFPEFHENNPSKIASGFGGIVAAILSLTYVGISLGLLATPIRVYFEYQFNGLTFNYIYFVISIAIILLLTIIVSFIIFPIALSKLKKHQV